VSGRPAVFLDRDGTLLSLVPYLHRPAEVRLVAGAAQALRRLGEAGYARILVTNQSGVARGWFSLDDVAAVHARMRDLLRGEGADLEGIEICPHHPDHGGGCSCRKPAAGMLLRAADALGIDLRRSWMIGDRMEDLAAGAAAGAPGILVLSGYGLEQARTASPDAWRGVRYVAWDLPAAAAFLLTPPR
jgi:D-glycero-D-manno-heptose 1,7-bisphosphate phosphatase